MPTFNSNKKAARYAQEHYGWFVAWAFHIGKGKIPLSIILFLVFVGVSFVVQEKGSGIFIVSFLTLGMMFDQFIEIYALIFHKIVISRSSSKETGRAFIYTVEEYKKKQGKFAIYEFVLLNSFFHLFLSLLILASILEYLPNNFLLLYNSIRRFLLNGN